MLAICAGRERFRCLGKWLLASVTVLYTDRTETAGKQSWQQVFQKISQLPANICRVLGLLDRRVCVPRHPRQHRLHFGDNRPKVVIVHRLLTRHGPGVCSTVYSSEAQSTSQCLHCSGACNVTSWPLQWHCRRACKGVTAGAISSFRTTFYPELGNNVGIHSIPTHLHEDYRHRP